MSRRTAPHGSGEAVIASAISVLFMLYWNYAAIKGGAPFIFPVVGVFGLYTTTKSFITTFKAYRQRKLNQDYYDYADYRNNNYDGYNTADYPVMQDSRYCPYCGAEVARDFEYCPKCGRKLR